MIYADAKGTKLSSEFAKYIQQIKFVEERRKDCTQEMMNMLTAYQGYALGQVKMQTKEASKEPPMKIPHNPYKKSSYAVAY